jgi:hypothetical protein
MFLKSIVVTVSMEAEDNRVLNGEVVRRWDVNQKGTLAHRYITVICVVELPSRRRSAPLCGRFVPVFQSTDKTANQNANDD